MICHEMLKHFENHVRCKCRPEDLSGAREACTGEKSLAARTRLLKQNETLVLKESA
jgi:hypothetical protein